MGTCTPIPGLHPRPLSSRRTLTTECFLSKCDLDILITRGSKCSTINRLVWWARRGSNSHAFRHWNLSPACLPIPPQAQVIWQRMSDSNTRGCYTLRFSKAIPSASRTIRCSCFSVCAHSITKVVFVNTPRRKTFNYFTSGGILQHNLQNFFHCPVINRSRECRITGFESQPSTRGHECAREFSVGYCPANTPWFIRSWVGGD